MKCADKITRFIDKNDAVFIVPLYQRRYSWSKENCRQLLSDLDNIIDTDSDRHFFGNIMANCEAQGFSYEYYLIDGQQRMTTVTLILLAIRNLVRDGKGSSINAGIVKDIEDKYLFSPALQDEDNIKLRLGSDDCDAFGKLLEGREETFIKDSPLTVNFKFFCDEICNKSSRDVNYVDKLYDAVNKLEIIPIIMDNKDKPQLIFESLNSTGLALTEGDKIRNYVLMGLPPKEQNSYYNRYWLEIERLTQGRVSDFTRYYLCIKNQTIPKSENIYKDFKKYAREQDDKRDQSEIVKAILEDMLEYAGYYNILRTCDGAFDGSSKLEFKMQNCLLRLERLDFSVTYPFFMTVLHRYKNTHLDQNERIKSEDDVFEIFSVIENFLLRRIVCDVAPNSLNKLFLALDKEIFGYEKNANDYVNKLVYALQTKIGTLRFPTDDEFLIILGSRDIYNMKGPYRTYILERYENYDTDEIQNIYSQLNKKILTIEHVMPQTLSGQWKRDLGIDRYKDIHKTWVHRLGNLTLTGYNSKLHNHSFAQKLEDPDGGFKASHLRINRWINLQTKWGEDELKLRTDELVKLAKDDIWKYPVTSFVPVEVVTGPEEYTLDDADEDFISCDMAGYSFKGKKCDVDGWAKMFSSIILALCDENETVLYDIANHQMSDIGLDDYFSLETEDFAKSIDMHGKIFVSAETKPGTIVCILRKLFDVYGFDYSDLVLYVMRQEAKTANPSKKGRENKAVRLRREEISDVIFDWIADQKTVKADTVHSEDKFVRFTTNALDDFIQFANNGLSEWKTENHHFYEIVNVNGDEVYIKLTLNSKNASADFMDFCEKVRVSYSLKKNKKWRYREVFRTRSFHVGDNISEEEIFDGLDKCLEELVDLESNFISRPDLK